MARLPKYRATYGRLRIKLGPVAWRGDHRIWAGFRSSGAEIGILVGRVHGIWSPCAPTDVGDKLLVHCCIEGDRVLFLGQLDTTVVGDIVSDASGNVPHSQCHPLDFVNLVGKAQRLRQTTRRGVVVPWATLVEAVRTDRTAAPDIQCALRFAGWQPAGGDGWRHGAR